MKWDMSEQYLPWRYFVGKSIHNGILPFWNPFQLGGSPSFADPQSAAWYYPAWLIGGTIGYSMRVIQLEILSFIILGGLGFFALSKKLGNSTNSSFIISLCYLASGFFVGNAQHLTWLAAAAWTPWLFYQYLYIRKEQYNLHLMWFLIVLSLYISSSYPAFVITSIYIILIDQIILFFSSNNKLKVVRDKLLLAACCFIAISPFLYSTIISAEFFSRGAGISLGKSLQHPFSLASLLSLIAPFSSFKNNELFNTDISMSNAYMGLFPIMLLAFYLFSKKNKKSNLWLGLSFLFLLISIGAESPIRAMLYHYIPGFNLFRFPSLFRLFFIISLLLFSATYYDRLKVYIDTYRTRIIIGITVIVISLIAIILLNIEYWKPFSIESLNLLSIQFENSNFKQHLIYQFTLQSILLIIFGILLYKRIAKFSLLFIICIDLFLSVRLNAMSTIVLNTKSEIVDQLIPQGNGNYQTPKLQALKNVVDQQYEYRWPLNWNMNCYYGEIAIDGYNPFVLNTFNQLENSKIKDSIFENNWYYFPSTIVFSDTINNINRNSAWIKSNDKHSLQFANTITIQELNFKSNGLKFTYQADSNMAMVFAQNPFPGWTASVDGHVIPIYATNFAHQLIYLNAGEHSVEWLFDSFYLNMLCYIHLTLFSLTLIFASIKTFQRFL